MKALILIGILEVITALACGVETRHDMDEAVRFAQFNIWELSQALVEATGQCWLRPPTPCGSNPQPFQPGPFP